MTSTDKRSLLMRGGITSRSASLEKDGEKQAATGEKNSVEPRSGRPLDSGRSGCPRVSLAARVSEDSRQTRSSRLPDVPRHSVHHRVAPVLRKALVLLVRFGWRPTHHSNNEAKGLSLSEAIQRAGEAKPECYYAKQVLTALIGLNYAAWEDNHWRTEAEVLALVRRAAECAEGRAFQPRRRTGPVVSMGPAKQAPRPAEVVTLKTGGAR